MVGMLSVENDWQRRAQLPLRPLSGQMLERDLHGELQLAGGGGAIRLCCRAAREAERTGIAQIVVWLRKLHPVE